MKNLFKKIALIVVAVLLISADGDLSHKLFIIGDSTSSIYDINLYPRNGWGQVLQAFFNSDDIVVVDKALSGRSSKSYYTDPNGWLTVLNAMGEGDYLFIQFGHNDQKDDERYTDPYTTYQEYLSIYIDSAKARGAYPVLLTSIHRNKWNGDAINDSHGDYPPAMRALAAEKDVPLIDLHAKTETLFENFGVDFTTNEIFMNLPEGVWINYPEGNEDNTHLQENGAFEVCKLIAEGITELNAEPEMDILENALVPAGRVIAMPNPYLSGTITGRGVYSIGEEVKVSVRGRPGYAFESWTEADTLLSDTSSFVVHLNDSLRELTANMFVAYSVILKQSPGSNGILEGYGYYAPGSEVTIVATPKEGYRFVDWQKDEASVTTDSIYTFTMGEINVTYTATFEELLNAVTVTEMKDIRIYPNPNTGDFRITGLNAQCLVEIYGLSGKRLYSRTVCENYMVIKSGLPVGIYLLKITQSGNTLTMKLVIE
jgi:uncharacterized repeat protein (TIGR02543 family)